MNNVPHALTPEGIRATRKRLKMTQEEFSQHIKREGKRGLAPRSLTISRWERGVQRPAPYYAPILLTIAKKVESGNGQPAGQ